MRGAATTGDVLIPGGATFIVMMSSQAAQSMLFGLTPALLPAMSKTFGGNGQFIAQMVSALAALGLMLTSIFSGQMARRLGVRRLLIGSALVFGAAGLVPAISANISLLLGSRLLAGGAAGLLTTGCALLLAHTYSGTARSKAMGYQTALGSVVGLVGLVGAGALVKPLGWQLPFLLYGVFALPVAILAFVGVPEIRIERSASGQGLGGALARIWPICAAGCLLMMVPLSLGSNVPFVLTGIGVTAPLTQSIIIAGVTVMSAAGGSVFGKVQSALGVRQTFATALILAGRGHGLHRLRYDRLDGRSGLRAGGRCCGLLRAASCGSLDDAGAGIAARPFHRAADHIVFSGRFPLPVSRRRLATPVRPCGRLAGDRRPSRPWCRRRAAQPSHPP